MIHKYKGYLISPSKFDPNLKYISTEGRGGKIPDCLSGVFTKVDIAKREIDRYLHQKVKNNAEECDQSRS